MIIAVSFSAWYLVEGMLYTKIMETINGANVKTLTWLAFLFCALIFIAYILCEKLIKTSDEIIAGKNGEKRNLSVKNIKNSIELIKQYKELLDSGIITEEEFEKLFVAMGSLSKANIYIDDTYSRKHYVLNQFLP